MGRKQDEEDEAAREKQEKEAKRAAAKEPVTAQPTLIGGLPAEAYLTEQEKAAAAGKPAQPTDEEVAAEAAKAKKEK